MPINQTSALPAGLPLFLTVKQAAGVIGMPLSLLEKSFMDPAKRPAYVPTPPPHVRNGRSIHILTADLPAWARGLVEGAKVQEPKHTTTLDAPPKKRGRPTNAELHAREGCVGTIRPQTPAKRGRPTNRERAAKAAAEAAKLDMAA